MVNDSRELPRQTVWHVSGAHCLLKTEEYYRASLKEQTGNTVSCDNMGILHTFAKKFKRVLARSSNTDTRRALREVSRRAHDKYSQEHVRGHQDRTVKCEDLLLEAQLNADCDKMTKEGVKGLITRKLREKDTGCH